MTKNWIDIWKSLEEIKVESYIYIRGYMLLIIFIIKCKEQNIKPKIKITIVWGFE